MATISESIDAAFFYYRSGNLRSTEAICHKILQQEPDRAEALNLLGGVACQMGNPEAAIDSISRAIELNDCQPEFYGNLATAYRSQKRWEEAITTYHKALEIEPKWIEGHQKLGDLFIDIGRLNEAKTCYQNFLKLQPQSAIAYFKLGLIAKDRGKLDEAIPLYQQAIQLQPNFIDAYNYLGQAFICQGKFDRAIPLHQRVLEIYPNCLDAIVSLAGIYERQRKFDEAEALLRPVIQSGTDHAGIIHSFAVLCLRKKQPKQAIEVLEKRLNSHNLTAAHRRALLFTLADNYDAAGDFNRAFTCYQEANSLKPVSFDLQETTRAIDNIQKYFTRERLTQLPQASNRSSLPIFIVGMPRSGTSLVEQILASHPQVFGAGERPDLHQLTKSISSSLNSSFRYPECLDFLHQSSVDRVATGYLTTLQALSPTARYITDKMPSNFLHLGLIQILFPGARIVHCVRHPLDTCLSCYFQDFLGIHAYAYDLKNLGQFYQLYWNLMKYWQQTINLPILNVRYEELVSQPESKIRDLVKFCDLEWNEACLQFHQSSRHIPTASYHQVSQPIYTKSVDRYKHYESHLSDLKTSLGSVLNDF